MAAVLLLWGLLRRSAFVSAQGTDAYNVGTAALIEVRRGLSLVLKRMFPRLMTLTATGRSAAHTKCRNEVKDLKRSIELCGRAVAENDSEAGKAETSSPSLFHLKNAILRFSRSEISSL